MSKLIEASLSDAASRDPLTFLEWSGGISKAQFLERERRLRSHPWALATMKTWFLVDARGVILSSCETFCLESVTSSGVTGHSYAIASVFTETSLRGQGYATEMMNQLLVELSAKDSKAQSVILFSDVGPKIYARSGFVPVPDWDRVIAVKENSESLKIVTRPATGIKRSEVGQFISVRKPRSNEYLIHVNPGQVDWRLERQEIYSHALGTSQPSFCGAQIGSSVALWTALYQDRVLKMLYFTAQSPGEADALLDVALTQARDAGLRKIVIWETPEFILWDQMKISTKREKRDGSLPMIYSYLEEIKTENWASVPNALWV